MSGSQERFYCFIVFMRIKNQLDLVDLILLVYNYVVIQNSMISKTNLLSFDNYANARYHK